MQDYHTHSYYSTDAETSFDDLFKSAVEKGLDEIAVTDHIDIDYPYDLEFSFDANTRLAEMRKVAQKYPKLAVKNGVEIGITPETKKDYVNIIAGHSFDFVIASIHVVQGKDPYYPDFFEGKTKEAAYRLYLEAIYDGLKDYNDFDVLGHIGYASRFFPSEDRKIRFEEYSDILDGILKEIIAMDKGLEVNTKGIASTGDTLPSKSILQRYLELGGDVLTFGSDAHTPERVGDGIFETAKALKQMGFKYYASYTKRKRVMKKL